MVGGFLLRDGKMGELVSGTRRIIEPGRYTPAVWLLEAKDNLGREIQATCRTHSDLLFTGYPDIAITWSLLQVEIRREAQGLGRLAAVFIRARTFVSGCSGYAMTGRLRQSLSQLAQLGRLAENPVDMSWNIATVDQPLTPPCE